MTVPVAVEGATVAVKASGAPKLAGSLDAVRVTEVEVAPKAIAGQAAVNSASAAKECCDKRPPPVLSTTQFRLASTISQSTANYKPGYKS